jgi:spore germination cell wall hydrolase CwlJ-like protein
MTTVREILLSLYTRPARLTLGLTLFGEARGEPTEGQAAVAWVIVNRARQRRQTVQLVCLSPHQFSCWPVGQATDGNQLTLLALARKVLADELVNDQAWFECLVVAEAVLASQTTDPTHGATFYCTAALLEDPAEQQNWFVRMVTTRHLVESARVGRHVFFTETT